MYRTFKIKKKNGKYRTISEPILELKAMQWALLERLNTIPLMDCVHGFALGKDIVSNAKVHRQKRYVLNIDVENFFPSVKTKRCMYQLGRWYAWTPETYDWIEAVCFWDGCLPQGAPTSPVLANIYMHPFDIGMQRLADQLGVSYTRYADDLTLSGGDVLKERLNEILEQIDYELGLMDLTRNKKKTKLMPYYQRQVVTGVVVNNERLTLSRKIKERLFQELKGRPRASLTENELGYLEHVRHIDPKVHDKLCSIMI